MCKEELSLIEIKKREIEILNHFDVFCKENNIRYFLSNGTLLGAVKYKGFIPWDDDIDVLLPREDYDKLIELYADSRYVLFEKSRTKKFRYPFAKLSDSETLLFEDGVNNAVELGINIDVLPLDYAGSNYLRAKKIANTNHKISMLLLFAKGKIRYNSLITPIENCVIILVSIMSKIFKPSFYVNLIRKRCLKFYNVKDSKYVACLSWPVYKTREVILADIFNEAIEIEFEGKKYPAPIGYDEYLHSLYGEYEKDPPLEKQITHHYFKVYKKNN